MKRIASNPTARRVALTLMFAAVAVAIAVNLQSHWSKLVQAVTAMDPRWMAVALVLCLIHRVVNTWGWTGVLWAMGRPMPFWTGARIWLRSEACRWLPGSVWAYGSRGFLASRAGIPPAVAAMSLGWELLITVAAWCIVAAISLARWSGPVPPAVESALKSLAGQPWAAAAGVLVVVVAAGLVGWKKVARKLAKLSEAKREAGSVGTSCLGLFRVLLFHLTMVTANGLTFWLVVRASPGGDRCPISVVLAANSIAWLAGLFALFAPGGLVVREASIVVLLSGWLSPEQALTAALAWRAIQIVAEVSGCLATIPEGSTRPESSRPMRVVPLERIEA